MSLTAIKKWLVMWKVRLVYANSYFGVLSMAILVTQTIQDKLKDIGIVMYYYQVFGILLLFGIVLAWGLDHFGVYEEELNYSTGKSTLLHKLVKEGKDGQSKDT